MNSEFFNKVARFWFSIVECLFTRIIIINVDSFADCKEYYNHKEKEILLNKHAQNSTG